MYTCFLRKLTGEEKPFLEWLIDESERNHKKQVQMAGDLGEAFSRIGELESKLKSMVSSSHVTHCDECNGSGEYYHTDLKMKLDCPYCNNSSCG